MSDAEDQGKDTVHSPDFPWTDDPDEQRRAFILTLMASADIDGKILVENMRRVETWLRTGRAPARLQKED